jgi:four helix bundle protein
VDESQKYDLEERTAVFGEQVIALCRAVPFDPVTSPIITQLVKASGSVGANYGEADDAQSRKDFRHKISICKKESRESKHHLRMIAAAYGPCSDKARILWKEAKELNLIFAKIIRSIDGK